MVFTKESIRRAARTFLQAFFGYIVMSAESIDFSAPRETLYTVFVGMGVSALAAGLAAVMNMEGFDHD